MHTLKSSNSSDFNPILQILYVMICEIIVSKTMCGIFLFFVNRVLLIILWRWTIFRNRKITGSEISQDPFIFKKFPHIVLNILSAQISWKDFFWKHIFFKDLELFHNWKITNLGVIFFHKKLLILYFFSRVVIKF